MGKETCKVTFLNTRITSGNWCRAFRNHMEKETCPGNILNSTELHLAIGVVVLEIIPCTFPSPYDF